MIKLQDGTEYTLKFAELCVEGFLTNNKTQLYFGSFVVEDKKNGMFANIQLNPNFKESVMGVMNRYTVGWF